jgi:putative membrane protein
MWYLHQGMGWWMVIGSIWMLLFWGGIIWLAVWGISKVTQGGRSGPSATVRRDPLDIAKERYAKGEISKEEFEQIKKDLS